MHYLSLYLENLKVLYLSVVRRGGMMIGLRERWSGQLHVGPQKFFPSILSHGGTCTLHEYVHYWNIHPYSFVYHLLLDVFSVIPFPLTSFFNSSHTMNFQDTKVILLSNDAAFVPLSKRTIHEYKHSMPFQNFQNFDCIFLQSYFFSLATSTCYISPSFAPRRLGKVSKYSEEFPLSHLLQNSIFIFPTLGLVSRYMSHTVKAKTAAALISSDAGSESPHPAS